MNTIPSSDNGAKIGPELIRLRLNATLKQSKLAERLKVDTSRISRIETGDLVPDEKEVVEIAEAIGSGEALEYAAYQKKKWTALAKPSFWHPSKNELAMAETHLARVVQFTTKPQTTESAKAQAEFYRTAILAAADYLRPLEHSLAFVGDIGVGKSTAICGLTCCAGADALVCRGGNKRRMPRVQKEKGVVAWYSFLGRGFEEAGA